MFAASLLRAAAIRRLPAWLLVMLPWCVLRSLPGMLLAAAFIVVDFLLLRRTVMRRWAAWMDAALPEFEDSSALLARAETPVAVLQRERLRQRGADLRAVVRKHIGIGIGWIAVSALAAVLAWKVNLHRDPVAQAALALEKAQIVLRVQPPRYTGIAAFESAPRDLAVPERSQIEWCLKNRDTSEVLELSDGQRLAAGRHCARWSASESLFWRWRGNRYTLRVTPDQPPQITVSVPKDMVQVLASDARSAAVAVTVRDDYAVAQATLHLTLARGSGENIRFSDRELPLPASADPKMRNWSRQWALAELGMEPGDELYFFVRASDNAEQPHVTQSPTYTLRLPGPAGEDDTASNLPTLVKPENLRSQRQIIIDTEQLVADMKVRRVDARARSEAIANDQAQLRRRYGQFLGEESSLFGEDEHAEGGKHDLVAEYGHTHDQPENATLYDEATKKILRRALSAMWDAEKALRAITPAPALPPEYKALDAIKLLQQADRIYLHKTAFAPPPIKEELRMTGDLGGAKSYQHVQGEAADTVPAELRQLIAALDAQAPLPALWSRTAHDWIRARIADDERRLKAQRAVQDVADGCVKCRAELRAWLRAGVDASALLGARPVVDTPFTRAWNREAR